MLAFASAGRAEASVDFKHVCSQVLWHPVPRNLPSNSFFVGIFWVKTAPIQAGIVGSDKPVSSEPVFCTRRPVGRLLTASMFEIHFLLRLGLPAGEHKHGPNRLFASARPAGR